MYPSQVAGIRFLRSQSPSGNNISLNNVWLFRRCFVRLAIFLAAHLLVHMALPAQSTICVAQDIGSTRAQFAENLMKIKENDTKEHVLKTLGPPDSVSKYEGIQPRDLPEAVCDSGAFEVWNYGSDASSDFATLGQVHFNAQGATIVTFGGGIPATGEQIEEGALRKYLRLLHTMPSANGANWNPMSVIRIVNAFSDLEKESGHTIIEEYVRICPDTMEVHQQVGLVLRVLHEVPLEPGYFPELKFGASGVRPKDPKLLPRFPIHFVNEAPLFVAHGYMFAAAVPSDKHTLDLLDWYKLNGIWRRTRIRDSFSEMEIEVIKDEIPELIQQCLGVDPVSAMVYILSAQLENLRGNAGHH